MAIVGRLAGVLVRERSRSMASLLQQLAILHSKIAISWTRTKATADSKECFQGDDSASIYSQRAQRRHVSRALSKSKPMQYQDVRIISHMLHSGHKVHAMAVELAVTLGHPYHTHTCKRIMGPW
jgi:hypothetical protein